jgi:tetratricopeptide (TPR) repeat protein
MTVNDFPAGDDYAFDTGYTDVIGVLRATSQFQLRQLDTDTAVAALDVLNADFGNIIEHFRWFNETETDARTDAESVEFYLELGRFMDLRGHWSYRRQWGWSLFAVGDDDLDQSDPRILTSIAVACQQLGETKRSAELYKLVLEIGTAQQMPDDLMAQAYHNYGTALWHLERHEEALENAIFSFNLAAKIDATEPIINAMTLEACVRGSMGQVAQATEIFQRLINIAVARHDLAREAEGNIQLGILHFEQGILEDARGYLDRALALYHTIGDEVGILDTQLVLALWHGIEGDADTSEELTEDAIAGMEQYPPEVFAQVVQWFDQMAAERRERDAAELPEPQSE